MRKLVRIQCASSLFVLFFGFLYPFLMLFLEGFSACGEWKQHCGGGDVFSQKEAMITKISIIVVSFYIFLGTGLAQLQSTARS